MVKKRSNSDRRLQHGAPRSLCNISPETAEARRPIQILPALMTYQGAIECQSLHLPRRSAGLVVERQQMRTFKGRWSDDTQLLIRGKKETDFIELMIPVEATSPQRLTLYATPANDYGILQFSVSGIVVEDTFDGYAPDPTASDPNQIGVFTPVNGKLTLRVQLVGAN